ncbi:hypothetical protein BRD00_02245 [Halobacteriales archaeon QS_8_69_26]|nr:MAG: hypothetical protein BRD00_02245 [Halobacteriales archaeon QS_8_69_26]
MRTTVLDSPGPGHRHRASRSDPPRPPGAPPSDVTEYRPVDEADLDEFRRLHNRYVDRDESPGTVRGWYEDHPELLVGAYRDGDLVGHCLGQPGDDGVVELAGIAVENDHQRRGIGTGLLAEFEARAATLGFSRVTLGSAGGYVDRFYRENGYDPESILVRLPPEDVPENYRDLGYEIGKELPKALVSPAETRGRWNGTPSPSWPSRWSRAGAWVGSRSWTTPHPPRRRRTADRRRRPRTRHRPRRVPERHRQRAPRPPRRRIGTARPRDPRRCRHPRDRTTRRGSPSIR